MCLFKTNTKPMVDAPKPEAGAEPTDIGAQRAAEDQQLFGDQGQTLRVNRDSVGSGVQSGGAGLRMM